MSEAYGLVSSERGKMSELQLDSESAGLDRHYNFNAATACVAALTTTSGNKPR